MMGDRSATLTTGSVNNMLSGQQQKHESDIEAVPVIVDNSRENRIKNIDDHYHPSVRIVHIQKLSDGSCGFHLSRSKWDPYPWVSRVDNESPAAITGVKSGDCVLEVNGEDILGMRITEVANLVRSKSDLVTLLLWTTGMDPKCNPESLCCGPMPLNLERLSASISSILAALECPVCMDTIPPPCIQCQNGHLVCAKCSMRAEKCPVCRDKYSPGRSLIAENVYNSITEAFKLNFDDGKLREKLFGARCKKVKKEKTIPTELDKPTKSHTHTFLAKLLGKSTSVDNIMSKKEDETNRMAYQSTNMDKRKSISLTTSEIYCPDTTISIRRCPSGSTFGCHTNEGDGSQTTLNCRNFLGTRRPKSCNVSSEQINNFQEILIHVPAKNSEQEYLCPGDCENKVEASMLSAHIFSVHNIPIISFGTSSAEISLPPRSPVENACLILTLDQHLFWLRLDYSKNGNIFVSGLMQANNQLAMKYALEIVISNSDKGDIFRKELITRHQVYDMESYSWKMLNDNKKGIFYSSNSLQTMFETDVDVILRATIKNIDNI